MKNNLTPWPVMPNLKLKTIAEMEAERVTHACDRCGNANDNYAAVESERKRTNDESSQFWNNKPE